MLSKLNFKKNVYPKSIDFRKKKLVHQQDSNPRPPECKSVALPIEPYGCGFDGMLLEFSPLLRLQPTVERNLITAFTRGDKLEVGG